MKPANQRKNILWFALSLCLAAATIWVITSQSQSFSFASFWDYVTNASPGYLLAAVGCMVSYVLYEALALVAILYVFGYPQHLCLGLVYAASDIFFSAITPSASGGQPASAYFMMRRGTPAAVTTVTLLLNLAMYALSLLIWGIVCYVTHPDVFFLFGTLSRVLILVGSAIQILLLVLFLLLIFHETWVFQFFNWAVNALVRLHLVRRPERLEAKMEKSLQQYCLCAGMLTRRWKMPLATLVLNLAHRAAMLSVSTFSYLAAGGDPTHAADIWAVQCYTALGSNCIPIPGAMGVSDYLMLDGFQNFTADPVSLELFSRSISFYACVLLCGLLMVTAYLLGGLKDKRHPQND
jgi:hypothetical protein